MIAEAIEKITALAQKAASYTIRDDIYGGLVLDRNGRVDTATTARLRQAQPVPGLNLVQDRVVTIAALKEYATRHGRGAESCCYITLDKVALVIDDAQLPGIDDEHLGPAWRRHRAVMPLHLAPAWSLWATSSRMSLDAFERRVAEYRSRFAHGDVAGSLLKNLRRVEATSSKETKFRRTANGSTLTVAESDKVAELPESIDMAIQVFACSARTYSLEIVLRPCRVDGQVHIETIPVDVDTVLQTARAELTADLAEVLKPLLVIEGSPGEQEVL